MTNNGERTVREDPPVFNWHPTEPICIACGADAPGPQLFGVVKAGELVSGRLCEVCYVMFIRPWW